jgi:hypothetical protein
MINASFVKWPDFGNDALKNLILNKMYQKVAVIQLKYGTLLKRQKCCSQINKVCQHQPISPSAGLKISLDANKSLVKMIWQTL